jgi:hypothetical protein
MVLNK